ncbi:unnamed protein product (macronuclear) [Paramecium tetraurelia]|uniref:Uncharacterized protein n=1 Tax=Paramecium tetraurelia TaxID=5888 RepID=A0E7K3_PARTE|nr:uncharacterized protein GSPATT00023998001 [Paramecium tetraurelia]CAK91270.1 unnamed protein product [Paramecium tetraurelia]|eukprot:XP_001458667.1 hypothetical protein (macronuclear) [Paramecium tetraurelia strain d4-2]
MLNSNYSTPVKHIVLTPKQELICNYNLLMNHYQELESQSQINNQSPDDQLRYQQIISKIDKVLNDIINNIAELQKSTLKDYSSFLLELRTQRENYGQKMENDIKKQQINYFDEIEKKEQQRQSMYQSSFKINDTPQLIPITSTMNSNSNSLPSTYYQSSSLPVQKTKDIQYYSCHKQLQNNQDQNSAFKQIQPQYQQLQPSNFRFKTSPPKQHFPHQILKRKEVNDIEPPPYVHHQQQGTLQSLDLQLTQPSVPLFDQHQPLNYNHFTSPDQSSLYDDYEQFISSDLSQSQNKKYQKKKIFDDDQSESFKKNQPHQSNITLNQQNRLKQNVTFNSNVVPINNSIIPTKSNTKGNRLDSQQNYINDLLGNLGYDQFYQYLCQRYPVQRIIQKFYQSKQNQAGLKQQNQALDFMSYIYCTQCDQFISINQANNHTNFCMSNKSHLQNQQRKYLDYFICCNGSLNNKNETEEQKFKRIVNDLAKIRYLMEIELKINEPLTEIQQKQQEYCWFALEILNLIIENPQNLSFNQQVLDLISIYQVLDQQQCNFYQQFVFLLQKANAKLQKII